MLRLPENNKNHARSFVPDVKNRSIFHILFTFAARRGSLQIIHKWFSKPESQNSSSNILINKQLNRPVWFRVRDAVERMQFVSFNYCTGIINGRIVYWKIFSRIIRLCLWWGISRHLFDNNRNLPGIIRMLQNYPPLNESGK